MGENQGLLARVRLSFPEVLCQKQVIECFFHVESGRERAISGVRCALGALLDV